MIGKYDRIKAVCLINMSLAMAFFVGQTSLAAEAAQPHVVMPSSPTVSLEPQEVESAPARFQWAPPQDWQLPRFEVSDWFEDATRGVAGKLEVGTRIVTYSLLDPDGDFMGTIDHLDEEQDLMPNRLFVDWLFSPYWGIELTWDELQMSTITVADGHDDGTLIADGPIFTVFGRYPNHSTVTPFAGMGLAFLSGSFDPETWWRLHYPGRDYWDSIGSPVTPLGGVTKDVSVEDTVAFVLTGGCDVALTEHFSASIYARLMWGELDAEYKILRNGEVSEERGTFGFPIDNIALGVGIKYRF